MTRLIVLFGLTFWIAACAGPASTGVNGQADVADEKHLAPQLPPIERAPWKMTTAMDPESAYAILETRYQQDIDEIRVIGISDGARQRQVVFFALDAVALWEEQAGEQAVEAVWNGIDDALTLCDDMDTSMCDDFDDPSICPQERHYQTCVMAAFPNPSLYVAHNCGVAYDLLVAVIEDGRITSTQALVAGECDLYIEPERIAANDIDGDGAVEFVVYAASSGVQGAEQELFLVVDAESLEVQLKDAIVYTNMDMAITSVVSPVRREDGYYDLDIVQFYQQDYCGLDGWIVTGVHEECQVSLEHRLMQYVPSRDVWEYDSPASSE